MPRDGKSTQKCPDWEEGCANKRQKKKALSGELNTSPRGTSSNVKSTRSVAAVEERLETLCECFADVSDPRVNRRRRHLLIDIIVIAVLAVIANADTWKDIQIWGDTHQEWLGSFLTLPHGIPSRDTFRRTISRIDPQEFQNAFLHWLRGLRKGLKGVIAIDGKTLRRSRSEEHGPLHIVRVRGHRNST